MSDPCADPGATHVACDCTLRRLELLERVELAAREYLAHRDRCRWPDDCAEDARHRRALEATLRGLKGSGR